MRHLVSDDVRYRVLKHLAGDAHASQRDLDRGVGVSLDRLNYCLGAVIEKRLFKARGSRKAATAHFTASARIVEEWHNATRLFSV